MIRLINEHDIDKVMEIWLNANIKAHDFIDKNYWIDNYDLVKNEYLPNSKIYVYEEEELIKGFIGIINSSFIGGLFVVIESQNKGIGGKLLDKVKDKIDNLSLTVYKDNINAIQFYKKNGFKIVVEEIDEDTNKVQLIMEYKK